MEQKIIGIDMDEVLSETIDGVLEFNNYHFNNIPITREDITNYYIYHMPKYIADQEYAKHRFSNYLAAETTNSIPVLGAKEKLIELKQQWYVLYVITARPDALKEITWKRIDIHFPWIFDDIIFANHLTKDAVSKSSLCQNLGIEIMIEDNLDYAIELEQAGITTYLLEKPRNQQYDANIHKNIIKVKGWREISIK